MAHQMSKFIDLVADVQPTHRWGFSHYVCGLWRKVSFMIPTRRKMEEKEISSRKKFAKIINDFTGIRTRNF